MKFRKKPVVIEAIQFTQAMMNGHDPWPDGVEEKHGAGPGFDACPIIHTLEGDMQVNVGDWVITGIKGERYPCRDDIFRATYEAANLTKHEGGVPMKRKARNKYYSYVGDAVTGTVSDMTSGKVFWIVDRALEGSGYHDIAATRSIQHAALIVRALNAYHRRRKTR